MHAMKLYKTDGGEHLYCGLLPVAAGQIPRDRNLNHHSSHSFAVVGPLGSIYSAAVALGAGGLHGAAAPAEQAYPHTVPFGQ